MLWDEGLGLRASRLACTVARRSKAAARAKPRGSLRRLCACPMSITVFRI